MDVVEALSKTLEEGPSKFDFLKNLFKFNDVEDPFKIKIIEMFEKLILDKTICQRGKLADFEILCLSEYELRLMSIKMENCIEFKKLLSFTRENISHGYHPHDLLYSFRLLQHLLYSDNDEKIKIKTNI